MIQNYLIADHLVRFSCPEEYVSLLSNYQPFVVDDAKGEPIYTLQIHKDAFSPIDSRQLVFADASEEDMPRIEVYHVNDDWLLDISIVRDAPICCHIRSNASFTEADLWIDTQDVAFAINNAAMLLFAFRTAMMGTLEMHASVIVKDGFGQLFLGHSGTGKSTHSRLWMEAYEDAWLLNDDNPVVRIFPNDEVWVYGSPWSGKTPCYKQAKAQVRGIIKLTQAPKNEIRRLRLPEAYAYMLSSSSGLKIVPEVMDALYETIARIIQIVPLYGLDCLPNVEAAQLSRTTLNEQ